MEEHTQKNKFEMNKTNIILNIIYLLQVHFWA